MTLVWDFFLSDVDIVSFEEIKKIKDVVEGMTLSHNFSQLKKLYAKCSLLLQWLDPRGRLAFLL